MAPPNKGSSNNRRPAARQAARPALDEIMEINTGDVIPLVDDDLVQILEDDAPPVRAVAPTMKPASDKAPAKAKPVVAKPSVEKLPVRRPKVEAKVESASESQETAVMQSLPARQAAIADSKFSQAFLYVEKGPGQGQLVPLLQGEMVIGRSSESGLQLNHPSVSRSHATMIRRGEQYFLRDQGSQNGTYVNFAKVRGESEIFPGDQISVGSAVLVLRGGVYNSNARPAPAAARVPEKSTAARSSSSNNNKFILGIVAFGAAVGIGVGGVYLLAGSKAEKAEKAEKADKVSKPVVAAKAAPARHEAEPAEVALETKVAETKPAPKPVEEAKPAVVAEAPKAETKPVEPAPAAPTKLAEVHAAPPAHVSKPAPHAAAHHGGKQVAMVEEAAPPAPSDAISPAVLKLYQAGNLEGAISAASSAGDNKAVAKLTAFKVAYEAGKSALENKDGGGAISNLGKALKLDEGIGQGWGKLNGEIRGQLAGLYILAGNQAMSRSDKDTAIKAFRAAQSYQPANAEARNKLKELTGGGSPAPAKKAPAGGSRSAADAAFDS